MAAQLKFEYSFARGTLECLFWEISQEMLVTTACCASSVSAAARWLAPCIYRRRRRRRREAAVLGRRSRWILSALQLVGVGHCDQAAVSHKVYNGRRTPLTAPAAGSWQPILGVESVPVAAAAAADADAAAADDAPCGAHNVLTCLQPRTRRRLVINYTIERQLNFVC